MFTAFAERLHAGHEFGQVGRHEAVARLRTRHRDGHHDGALLCRFRNGGVGPAAEGIAELGAARIFGGEEGDLRKIIRTEELVLLRSGIDKVGPDDEAVGALFELRLDAQVGLRRHGLRHHHTALLLPAEGALGIGPVDADRIAQIVRLRVVRDAGLHVDRLIHGQFGIEGQIQNDGILRGFGRARKLVHVARHEQESQRQTTQKQPFQHAPFHYFRVFFRSNM